LVYGKRCIVWHACLNTPRKCSIEIHPKGLFLWNGQAYGIILLHTRWKGLSNLAIDFYGKCFQFWNIQAYAQLFGRQLLYGVEVQSLTIYVKLNVSTKRGQCSGSPWRQSTISHLLSVVVCYYQICLFIQFLWQTVYQFKNGT
jgi:hypothetical protein